MADHTGAGDFRWGWAGGELHVVQWGDEVVAFHELTASTHLLDPDSSRILKRLRGAASHSTTTASLWAEVFGEDPSSLDAGALNERLQALTQAGLVTSASL